MSSSRPATRVEAKYNVTTEYPDLGLHSAAITGNVGLAHYALTHGQPENSVLHGLLPLHAASSGGSEQIVAMLIDRGADVNAPRLPRRYSNEGRKMPTVGVSGSGPLHFAAANGHLAICRLLLAKGALPDKRDKHGLTAEDLALANGHLEVVATLRAFQTLRSSLQERVEEYPDDSAVFEDDEDSRGLPPLRSNASLVGSSSSGKAGGMMRGLGNFASRGRRSSSSAAQRPASALSTSSLMRSSSLNRKPTKGRTPGDLSTQRTLSKLSLSSERSDSALSLSSPIEGPSSSSRRLATDAPPIPLPAHLTQARHRRPSLPSIIEKAAHQIAHPRAHAHDNRSTRTKSFASSDTHSIDSRSITSSIKGNSSRSLLKLFSRKREDEAELSPESASPSPPRSSSALQLDDEDIGRTIDSFRRLSFDVAPSSKRSSLDGGASRAPPPSAPACRTDFFSPSPSLPHLFSNRLQRSSSQRSEPSGDVAAEYSGRPGGSLWSIGARGGDRSPLVQDWSPASRSDYSRRRGSDAREDEWSSGSKGKGRAGSSMDDSRYLSSISAENDAGYSPTSPNGASPQLAGSRPPWSSTGSSPYNTETDDPGASTNRPGSQQSSNLSSLRRVASANLRRTSDDPYSPASSYGDLGYYAGPAQQLYQLQGDEQSTSGWNLRGIDPRRGPGFAGNTVRPGGRVRGASINSTLSSAFSVSPQLQTHLSEEDEEPPSAAVDVVPPAIFISATSPPHGRSRAFSGSSLNSNHSLRGPPTGGSGGSGSSYTAPSFLSSGAPSTSSGPTVPSVPEDHSLGLSQRLSHGRPSESPGANAVSMQRASSYAEAQNLVREAEKDLLDLPTKRSSSGGSTVSLAAQLAAYGERLAIEREFARTSTTDLGLEPPSSKSAVGAAASASPRAPGPEMPAIVQPEDGLLPKGRPQAGSTDASSTKSRGLRMGQLMGFQKHAQERGSHKSSTSTTSGPFVLPPPLDLGPVPQAPSAGIHHLATLPDVAKVYQDRAEALRRRGQKVASALSSPLTSPVSPSLRRGSHPPPSVEADRGKVWVISGQPSAVIRTPPTPDRATTSFPSNMLLPTAHGKDDAPSLRSASSADRKHSLDAHLSSSPLASNGSRAHSRLVPPDNLTTSPLRSSSPRSASRVLPSGASSDNGGPKPRDSPDTASPNRSRNHSPAASISGSSSRYDILRSSTDPAGTPSTASSGGSSPKSVHVGLGLGPIGPSSSSSVKSDLAPDEYGTKRKNSAPSWGSRFLSGISRKG